MALVILICSPPTSPPERRCLACGRAREGWNGGEEFQRASKRLISLVAERAGFNGRTGRVIWHNIRAEDYVSGWRFPRRQRARDDNNMRYQNV